MVDIDPGDWLFQGWIALRVPWFFDHRVVTRVGNALLSQRPNMKDVRFDESQGMVSFKEYREGFERADLTLARPNISFHTSKADRLDDWRTFNRTILQLLWDETDVFHARFNILQARQSVVIPLGKVSNPGKRLFSILGNGGPFEAVIGEALCEEIGLDQEFVFAVAHDVPKKLILRVQTPGPTATWLPPNQIWITGSAILDPQPEIVDDLPQHWESAQETLINWLANTIYPSLTKPLFERLG